jgi:DNA-binding FadR family transcriptional regulator
MDVTDLTARLTEMIASGDLPPDRRLPPERQLAERFGVTRARLRNALDALEHQGVLYRRQGRGTFAAPPTQDNSSALGRLARELTPHDIMEVRMEIEPALAAHAAARARADDIARLEQFMKATLDQSERDAYEAADDIFHYQIASIARNPLFLEIYDSIRTVRRLTAWGATRRVSHTPETMARLGGQHMRLFEAIASADSAEASRTMELHLLDVNQLILRSGQRVTRHTGD